MAAKNRRKTAGGAPFPKGQSGNPAGRPLGAQNKATREIKEAAAVYTLEALETLVGILRSRRAPAAAKVAAAREILDRGHGKAPQAIVGDAGGPVEIRTIINHHHLPAIPWSAPVGQPEPQAPTH